MLWKDETNLRISRSHRSKTPKIASSYITTLSNVLKEFHYFQDYFHILFFSFRSYFLEMANNKQIYLMFFFPPSFYLIIEKTNIFAFCLFTFFFTFLWRRKKRYKKS